MCDSAKLLRQKQKSVLNPSCSLLDVIVVDSFAQQFQAKLTFAQHADHDKVIAVRIFVDLCDKFPGAFIQRLYETRTPGDFIDDLAAKMLVQLKSCAQLPGLPAHCQLGEHVYGTRCAQLRHAIKNGHSLAAEIGHEMSCHHDCWFLHFARFRLRTDESKDVAE